jgi:hypothetical protein
MAILGREKVFAELKEFGIGLPEIILPLILYRHLRGKYNTFSGIAGKEDISLQEPRHQVLCSVVGSTSSFSSIIVPILSAN